ADDHHTPCAIARGHRRLEIDGAWKCRLLHDHVLPGGERTQRQVEVVAWRNGNQDRVHARIVNRGFVARVRDLAIPLAAELVRLRLVAARVTTDDFASERLEMTAVHARNEPAPEKCQAQLTARRHHSSSWLREEIVRITNRGRSNYMPLPKMALLGASDG